MFIHLHTHSYFSLLDGTASPEELVLAAKKAGMKALALTDHNGLYGAVEFYQKAREYDIKPIIGSELTLEDGFNIVVLIKDTGGYRNLCQLISTGRLNGGHNQFLLSIDDFRNSKNGLIILSGGRKGKIYHLLRKRKLSEAHQEIRRMQTLFGEDFYLEIQHFSAQDTLVNLRLRDLAFGTKAGLTATNDVHFITAKDWHLRRLMHAIDQNTTLDKVNSAGESEQYFKTEKQMRELFKDFPLAVSASRKIADACNFNFELGRPVFPSIELPEGESSFSHLWKLCFKGATSRYQPLTNTVTKRLEYELRIISSLGFAEYFLIVKDIADYCRREHIPCIGRGSAADSLVSYVLGITQADPVYHNLYFERFLNPERSDPPDIDLDICWKSRDKVLEYVYERFGHDRTAMICTYNTFQNRSSVRDVAKAHGLGEDEISKITKYLPHRAIDEIEEAVNTLPELKDLRHNIGLYEEIIRTSRRIADFPRHLSIHPGGVIIAPDRITYHTPLEKAGKDFVISQYDMYSIEKLGLVKMDLLGVRSLSVITDCLKSVRSRLVTGLLSSPVRADFMLKKAEELSPLDLQAIPCDDPKVTAYIRSGRTMGCFQLESPAMRGLLKKMKIEHINDIITAVALIRPGASGSGMKEIYIRRRAGLEKTSYIHPRMASALEDTYGVIIYQEQVLQVAHYVAGLSLGQADTLRRAMTKSRVKNEFMRMHDAFIDGASSRGLSADQAETVWTFLSQFVGYGFNKAHSATYGTIAYQTAFLKFYFPVEYMCAVLNNQGGFYSRMAYIEEVRRMGITILPPDVNISQRNFTCEGQAIRVGLDPVFELTVRTIEATIRARGLKPFSDLYDFIRRTRAGEKETEHLIKAGAFSSIHPSAPHLILLNRLFFKNNKKAPLAQFVSNGLSLPPFNIYQKIINEMEILDFAVTDHPLAIYRDQLHQKKLVFSGELEKHKGQVVLFCGWLVTSRRAATSKKQFMKFLTLEDRRGLCEAVLFPAVYNQYGHLARSHGPFLVTGRVQSRIPGETNLIVDKLELMEIKKEEIENLLSAETPELKYPPIGV
ncbi:MAG: DNA polymerase III subunit alpha [Calditrichaceae bacterium]|nr:DNA polymerase III subunit alpha [Calditrichaceae bacterium]RQV94168.1 MAG: DNA polymerase III subunit alpha [Calditrichota bacterium]